MLSEKPLVSIITPSFNQAGYLEQAIQSVLAQDYENIEYWVMDGGSTDGSLELLQRYDSRLSGWVSEADNGQGEAINKGFAKARGEIVAWLNSDDIYKPGAIAAAVEAFRIHPEAAFVYSDVESIDEHGRPFNRMRYANWGLAGLLQFKIIGQPGVFIRRDLLERVGGLDPYYHYILDHKLWLELAALAEPRYIPGQVWAQARMHSGAKNMAAAEKFGPEAFRLAKWIGNEERFYPLNAQLHRRIWAGAYRFYAFYLVEAGQPREALAMYRHSLRLKPNPALRDWKRIALAFASTLGLGKLRKPLDWLRRRAYKAKAKGGKDA